MSITLYDEILDSFEEAYGDYLHGKKDFYDSAAGASGDDSEQALWDAVEYREPHHDKGEEPAPRHDLPAPQAPDASRPKTPVPAADHADEPSPAPTQPVEPEPENDPAPYKPNTLLRTITSDELMTRCFPRKRFLVDSLLTPGLTVLAGSPKVGKSWLVLHLCMQIAKGEPFLGLDTTQGSVLYIALEDDNRRLQERVFRITDEGSRNLHLVTECAPIGERLDEQISNFVDNYRDTRLIVIDTFQKIREQGRELSYANDYVEVSFLKKIADLLDICILLVHHTRKQSDSDYMNEISGTNGIAGSADTLMVLKKESRSARSAVLSCTGRDIEDREMKLYLDRETCVWELKSDSLSDRDHELPDEIRELIAYMKEIKCYEGTPTGFANSFMNARSFVITPNVLRRSMNRWRYELADNGVSFESLRSAKNRTLTVTYDERFDQKPARDG